MSPAALTYTDRRVNGGHGRQPTAATGPVMLPSAAAVIFLSATGRTASTAPPGGTSIDCVGDLPAGGDTTLTVGDRSASPPIPARICR